MADKDDKLPGGLSPPAHPRKTPRRRASDWRLEPQTRPDTAAAIERDELGNAVWKVHVRSPRRRKDDGAVNPLDVLDTGELRLAEDDTGKQGRSFNPYDKSR